MKPAATKNALLIVLVLMAILIAFPLQGVTQASKLFDSPIPGLPQPCLSLVQQGYILDFEGYASNASGETRLSFRLRNDNKKDVSYVAFGVNA